MKQKSGPDKAPAEQVLKTSGVRHAGSIRPKRRSALCWRDYAAKRASRSSAAARALQPRCITAGPRSFLRPASTGWRGGTERSEAMKKADGLRHAADA